MEAHLGVTVIIHMKDEDHPDQGSVAEIGIQAHGERWDIGKYVSGLRKNSVLVMVTVKFGFEFSFSTESRGSTGTTHGLGSPKNWFSPLQLCHLGMLLHPHELWFLHLLNEGIKSFFSGFL